MKSKYFRVIFIGILSILPVSAFAEPPMPGSDKVYFDYFPNDPKSSKTLEGGVVRVRRREAVTASSADKLYAQISNVATVVDNGRSSNRIGLVFLGDGFSGSEMDTYRKLVDTQVGSLFTRRAPYVQYAPYFNVYRVDVTSNESGVDNDPYGVRKDTAFDSGYYCHGIDRLVCLNTDKVNLAAKAAPRADQKLVLVRSNRWGGAGYPGLGIATVVSGYGYLSTEIIIHEMGHSLGQLADEYDYGGPAQYPYAGEPREANISKLTSALIKSSGKKWASWLGYTNGPLASRIDAYEGAAFSSKGIYRPSYDSAMRNVDRNFNMPSLEALITEIYKKIRPIDSSTANTRVLRPTDTISIKVLQPTDHKLSIDWYLDGTIVTAAKGAKSFKPGSQPMTAGLHRISVAVVDNTPWVRNENSRATYLTQKKKWLVVAGDPSKAPVITRQPISVQLMEGSLATFRVKVANPIGVKYQWLKNGKLISGANSSAYKVKAMRKINGASFSCILSNIKGGVQSSSATLTVDMPTIPEITLQPTTPAKPNYSISNDWR